MLRNGRLTKKKLKKVALFTSSINMDYILAEYDIKQSIAHSKALKEAGIISAANSQKLISALKKIQFVAADISQYEDIHMAIEDALGEIGKKLHAGRSRNDQISCDMRMYIRDKCSHIIKGLMKCIETLKKINKKYDSKKVFIPIYTHLQRAQAVDLQTYLTVYVEWFKRDIQRFKEIYKRANRLPLGAAAGASSNIKLNLQKLAKELGFDGIINNPIDAVSSRDYIMEFANAASIAGVHFSRFAEEFIIFATKEFSFIELDESISETSSIMPQKKNPDCLELIRAASATLQGQAVNLMILMKGLPLAYNRDMQNDKAVFISAQTLINIIEIFPDIINNIKFNIKNLLKAAKNGWTDAADFAEYLVLKNVDFRVAHQKVGKLVTKGLNKGYSNFSDYSIDEIKKEIPEAEEDMFEFIEIKNAVSRRIYG